ncbi:uncharacterized protein LOC110724883 [Chenopodium quinoa]|uniref:RING-type domain-containing protein n=1 Tax=Chenopodium quinoa TaxID=63459 RepID=A0A803LKS2_CHEQI|nr:uncharacterized protein LOC110724883 [Chenopodium quinoa]
MRSDTISDARVCGRNRNSSKKKRGSKHGKSKQNKVDVTRDQRLSQVDNNVIGEFELSQSIPNGCKGDTAQEQDSLAVNTRKHEDEIPISCTDEAVSRMNGSSIRRFYHNSSSASCSSSCCDIDERCLDDWEAVADALTAENRQTSDMEHRASETESAGVNCRYQGNSRAWSLYDVDRPRSLPGLPKLQQYNQNQLPSEHCFSSGPSACPICCEDFDVTDLSFFPCPCGFQLCLFCHNKILEVDGRCPGCRKQYDSVNADADLEVQPNDPCSKYTWF